MARPTTGQIVERPHRTKGKSYAVRIMSNGVRRYVTLGYECDGWTREAAEKRRERIAQDANRRAKWQPPSPGKKPVTARYSELRKLQQRLDATIATDLPVGVRPLLREALEATYRCEDSLRAAIRLGGE